MLWVVNLAKVLVMKVLTMETKIWEMKEPKVVLETTTWMKTLCKPFKQWSTIQTLQLLGREWYKTQTSQQASCNSYNRLSQAYFRPYNRTQVF